MSISKNEGKAVQKILCIGGSTLNKGTIEKIKDALIETKFLQKWAVIFVNHDYFKISYKPAETQISKDKIQKESHGINIKFLEQVGDHLIHKNNVYILPDPSKVLPAEENEEDWRSADCIEKNGQVMLQVLEPQSSFEKYDQWFENKRCDAGGKERSFDTMPYIDKFMKELADVTTKIKDVKIAGLILCGLGGDGAYGLKEIKNKGGATAVQNPGECLHPKRGKTTCSMPHTALTLDKNSPHQKISIKGNSEVMSLIQWLDSIR
ncbi:hypothetical protein NG796_24325 [Laspinema sp. A4]|uniref:chemotaxis protein CheB n=1 Tax=Laspinema sp. D2d TaxID=2953686 RepID=UPI0021BAF80B|nr:chemotaxis protein CheB [Laspinema sp. D2d]MCT7986401.1 hypothetical protein [Laspinema sp. D2d]